MKATKHGNVVSISTARKGATVTVGGSRTAKAQKQASQPTVAASQPKGRNAKHARLVKRMETLVSLGVNRGQLMRLLSLSYSGVYGIMSGAITPSVAKMPAYHAALDAWCKKVGRV